MARTPKVQPAGMPPKKLLPRSMFDMPRNAQRATLYAALSAALTYAEDIGNRAPCVGDPLLYDGIESVETLDRDEIEAACRACLGCPALQACDAYAKEAREQSGIWAGVDRGQRHRENHGLRNRASAARSRGSSSGPFEGGDCQV